MAARIRDARRADRRPTRHRRHHPPGRPVRGAAASVRAAARRRDPLRARALVVPVLDVGPWNTNDDYWSTGQRPAAERGRGATAPPSTARHRPLGRDVRRRSACATTTGSSGASCTGATSRFPGCSPGGVDSRPLARLSGAHALRAGRPRRHLAGRPFLRPGARPRTCWPASSRRAPTPSRGGALITDGAQAAEGADWNAPAAAAVSPEIGVRRVRPRTVGADRRGLPAGRQQRRIRGHRLRRRTDFRDLWVAPPVGGARAARAIGPTGWPGRGAGSA